jgi:ribonuclease P/MRP protein subunit POP5
MKRVKRRYLALQLDIEAVVGEREFMDAVWGSLSRLYGEYGSSLASLALISFDGARKRAVLRANLVVVDNVRTALASITLVSGRAAAVHVLAVSGTIKALRGKVEA